MSSPTTSGVSLIDPALVSMESGPSNPAMSASTPSYIPPTLASLVESNTSEVQNDDPQSDFDEDEIDPDLGSELSSGPESAYEDEDLDRPPKAVVKRPRGRPRKYPVEEKGPKRPRGRPRKDKGKGKGKAVEEEEDDDDDVFDRIAGYVGRVPRGASVVPTGGVLHAVVDDDGDEEGGRRQRRPRRVSSPEDGAPRESRLELTVQARAVHKPTHEVSLLLSQSNIDYIQGNSQKAIEGFLEVIRLDPYIHGAWTSLGTLYEEEGNMEAARQMKFCGLHVEGDAEGWRDLAMEFKGSGQAEECLYCLRKALRKDPQDVMALWEISAQYKATGKPKLALDAFKKILRHDRDTAHDFSLLHDLHPIIIETKQYRFGADALRTAFDWHIENFVGPEDTRSEEPNTMTLENVVSLATLLVLLDELEEAIVVIRRGQRWLQGRRDQKQWDVQEDDREYDAAGVSRSDDADKLQDDEEPIIHPLDVNLRRQLAIIRLKMGNDEEAKNHIDQLLDLDVVHYQSMFMELGEALMHREQWEKALECYAKLQESEDIEDKPENILAIGICHYQMKNNAQALEALSWVTEVQPQNSEARLKLAHVLEDIGQKAEALEIVSDVLRIRAQGAPEVRGRGPNIDRGKQTKADKAASQHLTKKVLEKQMSERMRELWEEVQEAEAGIAEGDNGALDRFITAAGTMIENFRLAKANFSKNRGVFRVPKIRTKARQDVASKAREMQDRLERTLGFEDDTASAEAVEDEDPDGKTYSVHRQIEFYGLGCEEWLTLIVKYCCVLMVKNEEELAMEILEHVLWAGLFNNRRSECALRLTIIACAMRTKSYVTIADNCRRLGQAYQFRAEPFQLMLGCMGGGGMAAHAAWQNMQLQKFIHRELRLYDYIVKGYKFHYAVAARRWTHETKIGMSAEMGDELPMEEEEEDEPDGEDDEDGEEGPEKRTGKGKKVVAWKHGKRLLVDQAGEADGGASASGRGAEDDDMETGRAATPDDGVDPAFSDIPIRPTKFSPLWNWLYGSWMLNGRSFQSALFYLLRAYEHDQYNPLICFTLAQAYFGRAMVRQADNRNYCIAQGASFLSRYRKLSPMDDPVVAEEVEYNFGRAFHGIGVLNLAAKHYEKVLALVEMRMNEYENPEDQETIRNSSMALEASHNLMILYGTTGSMQLAKERSKWLAI